MTIDLLLLQLAIIFLPGLIWARLDVRYAQKAKPSDTEFLIRAFVFGMASYAVTFAIYDRVGWKFTVFNLGDASSKEILNGAAAMEIAVAVVVGIVLGIIWIYGATYGWLTWLLQKIHATKKYGDEDVWDYKFNSPTPEVEYINLRDFEKQIVYAGYVDIFSETGKLRELVLRDVRVFDFEGNKLFEVPHLYVARDPRDVHIEFPYSARQTGAT